MKQTCNSISRRTFMTGVGAGVGITAIGQTSWNSSSLKEYLRKSTKIYCTNLQKEVPLNIYFREAGTGNEEENAVIYVTNHGGERVGTESNDSILQDLIRQHYIVITADFANDPRAVSPGFDKDLHQIFRAVYGHQTESLLEGTSLRPIKHRCFFLPEGYRIAVDVQYWDIEKYGVYGTKEYVMATYNEAIAGKVAGRSKVSSPEELRGPKGEPFDYRLSMDVVYPSNPKRKVPLVFYLSTQPVRSPNASPGSFRMHMAGFTMRGYAFAIIDHCYNPVARHYSHIGRFTLDHWNGRNAYSAAIRCIRANASKYGIDSRLIGGLGHSKGAYAVTRLCNPDVDRQSEDQKYRNFPEGTYSSPQPWQGYPSNIAVGYQSMGFGIYRPQYISKDYAPTLVACGEDETLYVRVVGHPNFVRYLEEHDTNHIELLMEGLGHSLPVGYDRALGVDRYELLHNFFDRYLKVEERLPPVVLLVTPRHKNENASQYEPISVHFAPVIDKSSVIEEGIRLIRLADNAEVTGSWVASHGGTKFTFRPNQELQKNERYRMIVTTKVRDMTGNRLKEEHVSEFRIG